MPGPRHRLSSWPWRHGAATPPPPAKNKPHPRFSESRSQLQPLHHSPAPRGGCAWLLLTLEPAPLDFPDFPPAVRELQPDPVFHSWWGLSNAAVGQAWCWQQAEGWEVVYFPTPISFWQCQVSHNHSHILDVSFKAKVPLWEHFSRTCPFFCEIDVALPGPQGVIASCEMPSLGWRRVVCKQRGTLMDKDIQESRGQGCNKEPLVLCWFYNRIYNSFPYSLAWLFPLNSRCERRYSFFTCDL